jgi:surface protein
VPDFEALLKLLLPSFPSSKSPCNRGYPWNDPIQELEILVIQPYSKLNYHDGVESILAEETLVSQQDVSVGEIAEEPKALWRQPKVQRLGVFLLLLVIGVVVAFVVVVGWRSTSLASTLETNEDLRRAVDLYLADNRNDTLVAQTYGWPIGVWDVSRIQDFSYLFAASKMYDIDHRFNTNAENFTEDITLWNVSSATTMRSMFQGSTSFDQPIGNWDTSSVTSMSFMFHKATSFNRPLGIGTRPV